MPRDFANHDFDEEVRDLCRKATFAEDEDALRDIGTQLRAALREHMNRLRTMIAGHFLGDASHPRWNDPAQSDAPIPRARYFTRERDSQDGFVTWIRLASPKNRQNSRDPN